MLLILMVLNVHIAVIRSCRSYLLIKAEVNVVKTTVLLASDNGLSPSSFSGLRIIVIEYVQVFVPRSADQMILRLFFTVAFDSIDSPIDNACNVLVLVILRFRPLGSSRGLIVMRLLESLLLHAILDVKTICTASLISDE